MSDDPTGKMIMTVGTTLIFAFIFLAMTFGMGDWKPAPALTAQAPAVAPATIPR